MKASSGELPVLYSFRRCPYAMRARMAIAASGRPCELREVVLRDKPAALLEASPKGTVPVLVDVDGRVVDQSLDIMFWALGHNDPDGWLAPSLGTLDDMRALIDACDGDFKQRLDRYKYPERYPGVDARTSRAEGSAFLLRLDTRLADSRCLHGAGVALSDVAIVPFVRQFARVDQVWFDAQPWSHLRAWLDAIVEAPLFVESMRKFSPWRADRPGVVFHCAQPRDARPPAVS